MSEKELISTQKLSRLPPVPGPVFSHLGPIRVGGGLCQDLSVASCREWIVGNGIGGWASSTVSGLNTRLTHALLVASQRPPFCPVVLLSKVEETVIAPTGRFELSTNRYGNGIIHPEGFRYLVEFRLDPAPTFFYRIGGLLLEKTVFLLPGENAVVIGYTLYRSPGPVELAIRPLAAFRDLRRPRREESAFGIGTQQETGSLTLRPPEGFPPLVIQHTAEVVEISPCWYKNFEYLDSPTENLQAIHEDLWSPGQLLYLLKEGESCALVASTGRRGAVDLTFHARRLINTQTVVAQNITSPGPGPMTTRLTWSAENFIATAKETYVLAGPPGLSSWGRDALIALPGLLLSTRRFDAAQNVLETIGRHVKGGLLPVRFSQEDGTPEYDSADTSLWFFWAVWHYVKRTKERRFFAKKLLPVCREILEGYLEGTHFGIAMGENGLIHLSDEEMPLTWMDGRLPGEDPGIPGRAVTPRFGKPVEINALWYCALRIMGEFAQDLGLRRSATYLRLAKLVLQNFQRSFIGSSGGFFDCVNGDAKDLSIRPNPLIAASLPFSPLTKTQKEAVLIEAERHLLTPAGIRSLSPSDPKYHGRFAGNGAARAAAYHQGTVWTWLIGPYASAVMKTRGLTRAVKEGLRKQLSFYVGHLERRGLGTLSELFDGDPPHEPQGGVSRAQAVGEILRVIEEADLGTL